MASSAKGGASELLKGLLIAVCSDPCSVSHGCSGFLGPVHGDAADGGAFQKTFEARHRSTRLKRSEVTTSAGLVLAVASDADSLVIDKLQKRGAAPGAELAFDDTTTPLHSMVLGMRFQAAPRASFIDELRGRLEVPAAADPALDGWGGLCVVRDAKSIVSASKAALDKAFLRQRWIDRVWVVARANLQMVVALVSSMSRSGSGELSLSASVLEKLEEVRLEVLALEALSASVSQTAVREALRLCDTVSACEHFLGVARALDSLTGAVAMIDASAAPAADGVACGVRDSDLELRAAARGKAVSRSVLSSTMFFSGSNVYGSSMPSLALPRPFAEAPAGAGDSKVETAAASPTGPPLAHSSAQFQAAKSFGEFDALGFLAAILKQLSAGSQEAVNNMIRARLLLSDSCYVAGAYAPSSAVVDASAAVTGLRVLQLLGERVSFSVDLVTEPDFKAALADVLGRCAAQPVRGPPGSSFSPSISVSAVVLSKLAHLSAAPPLVALSRATDVDSSDARAAFDAGSGLNLGCGLAWIPRDIARFGSLYAERWEHAARAAVATVGQALPDGAGAPVALADSSKDAAAAFLTAAAPADTRSLRSGPSLVSGAPPPDASVLMNYIAFKPVLRARALALELVGRLADHLIRAIQPAAPACDIADEANAAISAALIYVQRLQTWKLRAMSLCHKSLKAVEHQQPSWFSPPLVLDPAFLSTAHASESLFAQTVAPPPVAFAPQVVGDAPAAADAAGAPVARKRGAGPDNKPVPPVGYAPPPGSFSGFALLASEASACSAALSVLLKNATEAAVPAYDALRASTLGIDPAWGNAPPFDAALDAVTLRTSAVMKYTTAAAGGIAARSSPTDPLSFVSMSAEVFWRMSSLSECELDNLQFKIAPLKDVERAVRKIAAWFDALEKSRKEPSSATKLDASSDPKPLPVTPVDKLLTLLSAKPEGISDPASLAMYAAHVATNCGQDWLQVSPKDLQQFAEAGFSAFCPPVVDHRTRKIALLVRDSTPVGRFPFTLSLPTTPFSPVLVRPRISSDEHSSRPTSPPAAMVDYALAMHAAGDAATNAVRILKSFAPVERALQLAHHHLWALCSLGPQRAETWCADPRATSARLAGLLMSKAAQQTKDDAIARDLGLGDDDAPRSKQASRKGKAASASLKGDSAGPNKAKSVPTPSVTAVRAAAVIAASPVDGTAAASSPAQEADRVSKESPVRSGKVSAPPADAVAAGTVTASTVSRFPTPSNRDDKLSLSARPPAAVRAPQPPQADSASGKLKPKAPPPAPATSEKSPVAAAVSEPRSPLLSMRSGVGVDASAGANRSASSPELGPQPIDQASLTELSKPSVPADAIAVSQTPSSGLRADLAVQATPPKDGGVLPRGVPVDQVVQPAKKQPEASRPTPSNAACDAPPLPASAGARPFAPSVDPAMLRQQASDEALARALAAGYELPEAGSAIGAAPDSASGADAEVEVADWESSKAGSKKKRAKDATASEAGPGATATAADADCGAGLGNRYGENNCYLNVVAQTLFRVQDFRVRFSAAYDKKYKAVRMIPEIAALPLDSREKSSVVLLVAVQATIKDMTEAASPAAGRTVSLNPLRQALYGALLAREVAIASAPTTTRAMAAQLASRSMADASEVMEEVITLVHESEAIATAAAAGVSAAALHAASTLRDSAGVARPLPPGCFSIALELSDGAPSFTSVSLSTFGMLLLETSKCPARQVPCGAPDITLKFTGLAQHINVSELLDVCAASLKAAAKAAAPAPAPAVHFDSLIHSIIKQSDPRACAKCAAKPLLVTRTLLSPARVVTVVLGWQSSREPSERLWPVLDAIDGVMDMRVLFPGVIEHALPANLRGMICFIDSHWVAFFATPRGWVCTNDERIFAAEQPIAQCKAHRLQPSILIYECREVGDAMPADRGRAALHGGGPGAAPALPSGVIGGGSVAAEAARAAVLADPAAFPALGGAAPRSASASAPSPGVAAPPAAAAVGVIPPAVTAVSAATPVKAAPAAAAVAAPAAATVPLATPASATAVPAAAVPAAGVGGVTPVRAAAAVAALPTRPPPASPAAPSSPSLAAATAGTAVSSSSAAVRQPAPPGSGTPPQKTSSAPVPAPAAAGAAGKSTIAAGVAAGLPAPAAAGAAGKSAVAAGVASPSSGKATPAPAPPTPGGSVAPKPLPGSGWGAPGQQAGAGGGGGGGGGGSGRRK